MDVESIAEELFARAEREQQVVVRLPDGAPVEEIRRAVRRRARAAGIAVRTGLVDDSLVVARLDADLWSEPAAVMRQKLTPTDGP